MENYQSISKCVKMSLALKMKDCYFTGNFRGSPHCVYNLRCAAQKYIPLVFQMDQTTIYQIMIGENVIQNLQYN